MVIRKFAFNHRTPRNAAALAAIVAFCGSANAGSVPLGAAAGFAVFGGSEVTNTGPSIITGDLGVSPGISITGFPLGIVTGTIHNNDAVAMQAHADAATAFSSLAGLPFTQDLSGQGLGNRTLLPGVYFFSSSVLLNGMLTLDGNGQADPLFVFQIGSTLTTGAAASMLEINGANADNVYFQVGSSATFGTGTAFAGTIIAAASDTFTTGASLDGQAFALTGAVTLDTNAISLANGNGNGNGSGNAAPIPPAAMGGAVLMVGLAAGQFLRPRQRCQI